MVDVSPDLLAKSKEWLQKAAPAFRTCVCKGMATTLDKFGDFAGAHTACHSWVTSAFCKVALDKGDSYYLQSWDLPYTKNAKPFLVLNVYGRTRAKASKISEKDSDFLVRWMAHESPFSEFILNRDDDETLCEGGVILLCGPGGLTLPQSMWVCKVLRFITEGDKAAQVFRTLVEGGVDGMLAVYIASHIRAVKGAVFGYSGVYPHMSVVGGGYNADAYKELPIGMFQRRIKKNAKSSADVFEADPASYPRGFKIVDPATKVKGFCKPFKKPDGWGGFVEGEGVTDKEIIERALEWQRELSVCLRPEEVPPEPVVKMPDSSTVYLDLDL